MELDSFILARLAAGDDIGDGILQRINEIKTIPGHTSWGRFDTIEQAKNAWEKNPIIAAFDETNHDWAAEILISPELPSDYPNMDLITLDDAEIADPTPISYSELIQPLIRPLVVNGIGLGDARIPISPKSGRPRARFSGTVCLIIYGYLVNKFFAHYDKNLVPWMITYLHRTLTNALKLLPNDLNFEDAFNKLVSSINDAVDLKIMRRVFNAQKELGQPDINDIAYIFAHPSHNYAAFANVYELDEAVKKRYRDFGLFSDTIIPMPEIIWSASQNMPLIPYPKLFIENDREMNVLPNSTVAIYSLGYF